MQNKKFDQISLEEFDSMNMDHTFSDNYNRKKQNLLHAVSESEHNRHRNHLYRVAAAIVALSLLPATAYAADRLLQMHYNSTGTYSGDLSLTTTSKDTVFFPVKLTPTYLPDGSIAASDRGPDKYYVPSDTESSSHGTVFSLYKMDTDDFTFSHSYMTSREEFNANGNDAVLMTFDSSGVFDKDAYVVFQDSGYIVEINMGNAITNEEAKKIASGVTLTPATDSDATFAGSLSELKTELAEDAAAPKALQTTWLKVNDTWTDETCGYQMTVKKVEAFDNIRSLNADFFTDNGKNLPDGSINDNGDLISYNRAIIQVGNGTDSLNTQTGTAQIHRKLLYVTLEITNPSDNPFSDTESCVNYDLTIPSENPDGYYNNALFDNPTYKDVINYPIYFDASVCSDNSDHHYFFTSLEKGQTITCHLGYIVDEDLLDQLCLNTSFDGQIGQFVTLYK